MAVSFRVFLLFFSFERECPPKKLVAMSEMNEETRKRRKMTDLYVSADGGDDGAFHGTFWTIREIFQPAPLCSATLTRVEQGIAEQHILRSFKRMRIILIGAGSSAYAAEAVSAALPGSIAVPATDLLIDAERRLRGAEGVSSLARSSLDTSVVLDSRLNDRSQVKTSSWSNLVLAGYCLAQSAKLAGLCVFCQSQQ